MNRFHDRLNAGTVLADQLTEYANRKDVIVLALPRGGVPVAYEIARRLGLPLDVFIVRKLGVPGHEELAMGAIASGGTLVYNDDILENLHIDKPAIARVIHAEEVELQRREAQYRDNRPLPDLSDKTLILVDDGVATGATLRAAIRALRQRHPVSIIVAVPVASFAICDELSRLADKLVCPLRPHYFNAVGAWYDDFSQTSDEEVAKLLKKSVHFQ